MKPHIICHMLVSVDGKIDGASLRTVAPDGEYEATGAKLDGDGWVCGRVTAFCEGRHLPVEERRCSRTSVTICCPSRRKLRNRRGHPWEIALGSRRD